MSVWTFALAYLNHRHHRRTKKGRLLSGIVIGGLFAMSLTVFTESLLYRVGGISFYTLAKAGSLIPLGVFFAGALQGVVYEYVGSIALGQWYYPTVHHRRHLFLLLPFFWALFMVIMQDTYAICRAGGLDTAISFAITALIPFALIEGINVYTKSWVYQRLLRSVPMLIIGWFILAYTFVYIFNQHVVNIFSY